MMKGQAQYYYRWSWAGCHFELLRPAAPAGRPWRTLV